MLYKNLIIGITTVNERSLQVVGKKLLLSIPGIGRRLLTHASLHKDSVSDYRNDLDDGLFQLLCKEVWQKALKTVESH